MRRDALERRALQAVVALLSFIPILAGLAGVLLGPAAFGARAESSPDLDSHVRYLSGLLLAIGLGFLSTVPAIERQGPRFRLLTVIVFVGGLARLGGLAAAPLPGWAMLFGLAMELLVTPALALWREWIERLSREPRQPP